MGVAQYGGGGSGTVIPTGFIAEWAGSIATIPNGWALCNGGNGTPDLRNRFVVCADADVGGVAKSIIAGVALQSGGTTTVEIGSVLDSGPEIIEDYPFGTIANTSFGQLTGYVQPFYALAYIMKL